MTSPATESQLVRVGGTGCPPVVVDSGTGEVVGVIIVVGDDGIVGPADLTAIRDAWVSGIVVVFELDGQGIVVDELGVSVARRAWAPVVARLRPGWERHARPLVSERAVSP